MFLCKTLAHLLPTTSHEADHMTRLEQEEKWEQAEGQRRRNDSKCWLLPSVTGYYKKPDELRTEWLFQRTDKKRPIGLSLRVQTSATGLTLGGWYEKQNFIRFFSSKTAGVSLTRAIYPVCSSHGATVPEGQEPNILSRFKISSLNLTWNKELTGAKRTRSLTDAGVTAR